MKRAVVVSDLHFGSIGGLLPPRFKTTDGIIQPLNPAQVYLWKCWKDFCGRVKEFKPDCLIVNGDVVEGIQYKEGGAGLSLRMMTDQKNAAIVGLKLLMEHLPDKCPLYFIQGTKYHVGENGEHEETIAATLGAKRYQSIGSGDLVREVLWLDVDGVLIEVAHAISGAFGFYRSTPLDREMQWSAMSAKDRTKGIPKVDLIIRSHVHHFLSLEHSSKQGAITPCWQLQMKYARKNSVHRMLPDIGGLFVKIDPEAKRRGEPPCHIIKQLYDLPPVPVTQLEWHTKPKKPTTKHQKHGETRIPKNIA